MNYKLHVFPAQTCRSTPMSYTRIKIMSWLSANQHGNFNNGNV